MIIHNLRPRLHCHSCKHWIPNSKYLHFRGTLALAFHAGCPLFRAEVNTKTLHFIATCKFYRPEGKELASTGKTTTATSPVSQTSTNP